jgi:preprotein translocase subunit SecF
MKRISQILIVVSFAFFGLQSFTLNSSIDFRKTKVSSRQSDEDEAKRKEYRDRWEKALGTFQFQVINSRLQPSINVNIIEKIESNRHQTDTVYLKYTEEIRIMILPVKTIQRADFKKLDLIRHISQN